MEVSRYLRKRIDEYREAYGKAEDEVMEITKDTFGGSVKKATPYEDKYLHVDFWWFSPKKGKIGVDVKGTKKNKYGKEDDSFQWLEFVNVNGKKGWLYGEEEYVAFKTLTDVIYVRRSVLAEYAERMMGKKEVVDERPDEYFIPYTRSKWGRKDVTMKVPTSDIRELAKGKDEEGKVNGFFAVYA